jgi:hypothetical protein
MHEALRPRPAMTWEAASWPGPITCSIFFRAACNEIILYLKQLGIISKNCYGQLFFKSFFFIVFPWMMIVLREFSPCMTGGMSQEAHGASSS